MIGVIADLGAGLLCIILGLMLWKKRKLSLLHSFHYKNVKETNIPGYTRLMGTGLILTGAGICITGLFNLYYSSLWWIPLAGGITSGIIVMHRAQKKYNGSWFS